MPATTSARRCTRLGRARPGRRRRHIASADTWSQAARVGPLAATPGCFCRCASLAGARSQSGSVPGCSWRKGRFGRGGLPVIADHPSVRSEAGPIVGDRYRQRFDLLGPAGCANPVTRQSDRAECPYGFHVRHALNVEARVVVFDDAVVAERAGAAGGACLGVLPGGVTVAAVAALLGVLGDEAGDAPR